MPFFVRLVPAPLMTEPIVFVELLTVIAVAAARLIVPPES